MEFNEKIKEIRSQNNLTQEQLAEKLYVSRTAISKWESGKGYPSIDSLKEISKIFNISIDELLSSEKLINIAEEENKTSKYKIYNLVYSLLDFMCILFIFLPFYGQKVDEVFYSVSLISYIDVSNLTKGIYFVILTLMVGMGILEIIFHFIENKKTTKILNVVSLIVHSIAILVFALSRQPYITAFMFMMIIIKVAIIMRGTAKRIRLN